jgi:hypothetical protein
MWLFLIFIGHLFVVCPARGDLAPLKVSGRAPAVMFPHQYIRMDYMDVTIRLKKSCYRVNAVFHFFNTWTTTTEWVGFLKRGDMGNFMRYDAWIDGQKTNVLEEPSWVGRKFRSLVGDSLRSTPLRFTLNRFYWLFFKPSMREVWLMQEVKFPRNLQTTIRINYEAKYEHYDPNPCATYEYGTGGYWKGGIGVAAITIDGTDIGGVKDFTLRDVPGWRRLITKDVLRLETIDYKPNPDEQLKVEILHRE